MNLFYNQLLSAQKFLACMPTNIRRLKLLLAQSPVRYWVYAFVIINVLLHQPSGANPDSRLATMASMSEYHSFEIKNPDWSMDLSQTPDGKLYSNKAPGPMFLGFPLFLAIDTLLVKWRSTPEVRMKTRMASKDAYYIPLALCFQMIPYALLVVLLVEWLSSKGASQPALHFAALAMLFGNTAAVFMNTWFGHGVSALFILAMLLALFKRKPFWVAFCFGWALLSDYGAATLLPFVLIVMVLQNKFQARLWTRFALGSLIPGALWIYYHSVSFGGPFEIALKHQMSSMHNFAHMDNNVWGIMSQLPQVHLIIELLVGKMRGLLWTQPWALLYALLLPLYVRGNSTQKLLGLINIPTLVFLIMLNASFGGWWGGGSSGPRYLSIILPAFGLAAALLLDQLPAVYKKLMWVNLFVAIALTLLIHATTAQAFPGPLWEKLIQHFMEPSKFYKTLLRTVVIGITMAWAIRKSWLIYSAPLKTKANR